MNSNRTCAILMGLLVIGSSCNASSFTRQAASGQPKTVYVHRNWGKNCEEQGGVVIVVGKPIHGRLSRRRVVQTMENQGSRTSDTHCNGQVIPGLQVQYTSAPGFRGTDSFTLQRTLPNGRVDVDTYTIEVY
jgi:hypothetical protein